MREVICNGCGSGVPTVHAGDHYWIDPHDCERVRAPITRIGSVVVADGTTTIDGWDFQGGLFGGWSLSELRQISVDLREWSKDAANAR